MSQVRHVSYGGSRRKTVFGGIGGWHAPFALSWMTAVGERTSRMPIGTSVLPPTFRDNLKPYMDAGFTHLVFHGPGHDQERFLVQLSEDVVPALRELG